MRAQCIHFQDGENMEKFQNHLIKMLYLKCIYAL